MTAPEGEKDWVAKLPRWGGKGLGLLGAGALLHIGASLGAVMLAPFVKGALVVLELAYKTFVVHLSELSFFAPLYAALLLLVPLCFIAVHRQQPLNTAPKPLDPHIAAFGIRPLDAEKEARKAKRGDAPLDRFWNNHAHKVTFIYFVIGIIVLGRSAFLTLQSEEPNLTKVTLTSYFVLLTGACIGYSIATWRGRQFERQLQQERFAQAIDMLARVAGRHQSGDHEQRRAALILLNDLPRKFLFAKRNDIADVLMELNVDIFKLMGAPSLYRGNLMQALVGTRAQTAFFAGYSPDLFKRR